MIGKTKIEKAWLAASLLTLFAYRVVEGGGWEHPAGGLTVLLQFFMILLAAPLGLLAMLPVLFLVDACDNCGELRWLIDWSTVLFFGYLQWFVIVPEMRNLNRLTFLKLDTRRVEPKTTKKRTRRRTRKRAPAAAEPPPAATTAAATTITVAVAPPREVVRAPARAVPEPGEPVAPPSPHFDEEGLTPLGKVLTSG